MLYARDMCCHAICASHVLRDLYHIATRKRYIEFAEQIYRFYKVKISPKAELTKGNTP